jgi:hypothetical protein
VSRIPAERTSFAPLLSQPGTVCGMAENQDSLPNHVRRILSARKLTLADVARASRTRFPDRRDHHIRHNFYHALGARGFRPSLQQMFTLSVISGYRFADWMTVFGFSFDHISRFQASFVPLRTVELDGKVYHPTVRIPWFKEVQRPDFDSPLVPLSRWLTRAAPRTLHSLSQETITHRFVKIGSQDVFAFPDLLPGSIVRVKPSEGTLPQRELNGQFSKTLFLVKHSRGLTCARLQRMDRSRFLLCSAQLPYAPIEFEEGKQGVILGMADLEIRPMSGTEQPVVPPSLGRFWSPASIERHGQPPRLFDLIRAARERSGLSFREASARTNQLAELLGRPEYSCAPSSLSDYETRASPPRHAQKMISLCSVYDLAASQFLAASGLRLEDAGSLPMPDEFIRSSGEQEGVETVRSYSYFFDEMRNRFRELPLFLRDALPTVFGMIELSIRDVFWAGGIHDFTHRYLAGCAFLIVNRKRKAPRSSLSSPIWAQPLYVLQRRDGHYLCGTCSLQNGTLMVRPCLGRFFKILRLRNAVDAEVIGKVVGVVRKLL